MECSIELKSSLLFFLSASSNVINLHLFSYTYREYKQVQCYKCFFSSILSVIMAGSFKLFLFVQKSYGTVGIYSAKQNQNQNHLFNSKCVFFLIFSAHIFISMVISAVTESKSVYEIALGFYLSTTSLLTLFIYISNIFYSANIFELIGKFEKFIEKSKFIK